MIDIVEESEIIFSKWQKWELRDSPYRAEIKDNVPPNFGILGIYLLAAPMISRDIPYHTDAEIIYIGMSTHITQRLYQSHSAVKEYKKLSDDQNAENLFYSDWASDWNNWEKDTGILKVRKACVNYIERKLIWEYAKKNERLPEFNKI